METKQLTIAAETLEYLADWIHHEADMIHERSDDAEEVARCHAADDEMQAFCDEHGYQAVDGEEVSENLFYALVNIAIWRVPVEDDARRYEEEYAVSDVVFSDLLELCDES